MSWRRAGTTSNPSLQQRSRLKEVQLDPLEAIGLPSKGDNRLLDFKIQEDFYTKILGRYEKLQNANGQDDTPLDHTLASLSMYDPTEESGAGVNSSRWVTPEVKLTAVKHADSRELATLVAAMRKLREAIVASGRVDTFALSAYVFIVHATILTGQMESYHPALLHLLRKILPAHTFTTPTRVDPQPIFGYYILDLACRQDDLGRAFQVRHAYDYRDSNVEGLLRAIVRGDWCLYWRKREMLDRYQRRLCQWRDEKMTIHALNCLGNSYLSVQKEYVEEIARQRWTAEGLGKLKPTWELEGSLIVIKRIKKR